MAELSEAYLSPGDFCFAGAETRIHTVLGSCVSITIWHPGQRIGGMCHYMLPGHSRQGRRPGLDGRYADDAVQMFLREVHRSGTQPAEYEVKMFGGGDQFPHLGEPARGGVARQNIDIGRTLLAEHGFALTARHLGGSGSRRLIFELANGHVWLKAADQLPGRALA